MFHKATHWSICLPRSLWMAAPHLVQVCTITHCSRSSQPSDELVIQNTLVCKGYQWASWWQRRQMGKIWTKRTIRRYSGDSFSESSVRSSTQSDLWSFQAALMFPPGVLWRSVHNEMLMIHGSYMELCREDRGGKDGNLFKKIYHV